MPRTARKSYETNLRIVGEEQSEVDVLHTDAEEVGVRTVEPDPQVSVKVVGLVLVPD